MLSEDKLIALIQEYIVSHDQDRLSQIKREKCFPLIDQNNNNPKLRTLCLFSEHLEKVFCFNCTLIKVPKHYRTYPIIQINWKDTTPAFTPIKSKVTLPIPLAPINKSDQLKSSEQPSSSESFEQVCHLGESSTGCIISSKNTSQEDLTEEEQFDKPLPVETQVILNQSDNIIEELPPNSETIQLPVQESLQDLEHLLSETEDLTTEENNNSELIISVEKGPQEVERTNPKAAINQVLSSGSHVVSSETSNRFNTMAEVTQPESTVRPIEDKSKTYGSASNTRYVGRWLVTNDIFSTLVFHNLDYAPFNGLFDADLVCQYVEIFCRLRCVYKKVHDQIHTAITLAMAELHGAKLEDYHLNKEKAQKEFIKIMAAYQTNPGGFLEAGIGSVASDEVVNDMDIAVKLLKKIYEDNNAIINPPVGPIAIVANTLCSYAKRGSVSDAFKNKVEVALTEQLSKRINISVKACKMFYENYKNPIDENSARDLFNHWKNILPTSALKLQLIVQQTAGSGLTAYYTVCKAISLYGDFPWHKVKVLLAEEWTDFISATKAVKDNPYYGFRHDLASVRSTKYKSIAWVAKELLMEYNGERGTLKNYAGWIKHPISETELQKLIDDYGKFRSEEIKKKLEESSASDDLINDIKYITDCYQSLNADANADK